MTVRSVSLALAILRLLTEAGPLSLSEIGRATGLSPSSCLNLLRTLVEEGAIERGERGKQYRLTQSWAAFAALQAGAAQGVIARARPLIAQFAQAHDASAGLWRMVGDGRIQLVARTESSAETRIHLVEGQRQPLGGGAAGRSIAAAMDLTPDQLQAAFAAVRWQRPPSFDAYLDQIAHIRAKGYAVDDGQMHVGICSVSAALPHDTPEFCLSASIFAGSRTNDEVEALGRALADLARSPTLSARR